MWPFDRFPYTDFHRLNSDWILEKVKEAAASVAESLGLVRQSAADAAAAAAAAQQAVDGSVRYDRAQALNANQQTTARNNIGAAGSTDVNAAVEGLEAIIDLVSRTASSCVRYDGAQGLSRAQQAQARENIGAVSDADLDQSVEGLQDIIELVSNVASSCVRYDGAQGLNTDQQTTARNNIGAASGTDVANLSANLAATNIALNNTRGIAQAAQTQAAAAEAAVANKAKVFRFTVNHPAVVGSSGVILDNTQWSTPFQDLLAALDDTNTIPVLTIQYETGTQGEYSPVVQVVPTIEQKDQNTIILSWFNVPAVGSPVNDRLVVNAATETATYYEYAVAYQSYVDGRITANAPLLVQFTGNDDAGNAACNRTFNEIRNAMFNNRAVRMVCVVGQMQYDLIPTRYTGAPQSVGGDMISVASVSNTGGLDAYIRISCSISATDRVSVQIVDNM